MQAPDPSNIPSQYATLEKLVFQAATFIHDRQERDEFLQVACQDHPALRTRIDSLLRAADAGGTFMRTPPVHAMAAELHMPTGVAEDTSRAGRNPCDSVDRAPSTDLHEDKDHPAHQIGPYRLLEKLGEGGMGEVYLAQQQTPIRRQVALKVIKAGMDTRQVIARFQAEQQALALMDHPNIARVFDAGATETGHPYFVMELVAGVPITDYCDQHKVSLSERLRLMVQVCHAVQHAHHKGIIHRDLKPSNVLITRVDCEGVPKVIDFGLAKAIRQQPMGQSVLTILPGMIGTPLYMSPEQTKTDGVAVDTRTDIYSLGVMLYELLVGGTPFDRARFHSASADEVRRIIREDEPPRPSTRISKVTDANEAAAACRGTDRRRWRQRVAGDLDWIVMKCLEKEPNRRYSSANDLALDIERYLHDESVEASPPTPAYRLTKFIRRNKLGALAGAAMATFLVATVAILTVSNGRIRRESNARAQALRSKEASLATTRQALRGMTQLESELDYRFRFNPSVAAITQELREDMLGYLEPIVAQADANDESAYESFVIIESIADIQMDLGRLDEARRTAQRCVDIVQKRLDIDPDDPVYQADLGRARQCMLRIMTSQRTSENEREFVAYANEVLTMLSEYNRRHPANLQPIAFPLAEMGKAALEYHGDEVTAERYFREGVARCRDFLRQDQSNEFERYTAVRCAIWLGRVTERNPAAGPEKAAPMYELARQWSQSMAEPGFLGAVSDLQLGMCRFHNQPTEQAMSMVQKAATNLRALTTRQRRISADWAVESVSTSRWAQATLVRQRQRLGRSEGAAEAVQEMAEWLDELAPLVPNDARADKELRIAQTEAVELMWATGQLPEAVRAARQHVAFWESNQRGRSHDGAVPQRALCQRVLALALTAIDQTDEARLALETSAKLGPVDHATMNQLAWQLVMDSHGDPVATDVAIQSARQATVASPKVGDYWKTLGAALYRAGKWQSAIEALEKANELPAHELQYPLPVPIPFDALEDKRKVILGGDALGWFFLAMAHGKLDHQAEACSWFAKATAWMDANQPHHVELKVVRAEATDLMGAASLQGA